MQKNNYKFILMFTIYKNVICDIFTKIQAVCVVKAYGFCMHLKLTGYQFKRDCQNFGCYKQSP